MHGDIIHPRLWLLDRTLHANQLGRCLRAVQSHILELLVWQGLVEVPNALTNQSVFEMGIFHQVLKPVFYDRRVVTCPGESEGHTTSAILNTAEGTSN